MSANPITRIATAKVQIIYDMRKQKVTNLNICHFLYLRFL